MGIIVGYSYLAGNSECHAFLYDGTFHDLGTLGGNYGQAMGVNNSGQVVGSFSLSGDEQMHAFLYDGTMHDLGTVGGSYSEAAAINASGQIVGYSQFAPNNGNMHAFVVIGGVMYDLNDLIPAGSNLVLERAWDINDSGWIVGVGTQPNGLTRAFLLTPVSESVPEPATLTLLATGLLGALGFARRRAK